MTLSDIPRTEWLGTHVKVSNKTHAIAAVIYRVGVVVELRKTQVRVELPSVMGMVPSKWIKPEKAEVVPKGTTVENTPRKFKRLGKYGKKGKYD